MPLFTAGVKMKCFSSISTVLLLSIDIIVFVGVNSDMLPCHSCATLLTNQGDITPNCNRTVTNCDDQESFCGVTVLYVNNTGVIYREHCVNHHVCSNLTADCSEDECFVHCCHKALCNKYDQVYINAYERFAHIIEKYINVDSKPNKTIATELPSNVNKTIATELPSNVNKTNATELPSNVKPTNCRKPCSIASAMKCSEIVLLLFIIILKVGI